ncbi:Panacea domain-containing protein [Pseudahrensia aquimaris]|uniref:Panacea domain-containing protein n=1 Tax=Pseudahrensia aquimaris TaxID=744461 RepID=A0ABW3FDF5_9HYPH
MTRARWEDACAQFNGDMTATPQQIANYFLDRADQEGITITQMKLVKLVYIAYGWYIALTGKKLFDEKIIALDHGPVISSLLNEFRRFGREPITERATQEDLFTEEVIEPRISLEDSELQFILSKVWGGYKRFSASALRNKTHETDSPWAEVYSPKKRGAALNDETIASHYKERISRYLDAAQE